MILGFYQKAEFWLLLFLFLLVGCGKKGNTVYTSIEDAHTIGVLLGSAQDAYVTEHFPEAEILRIDMSTDLISALEAGEIVKANARLGILQRDLFRSPCGMAFNKEEHELCASFNGFLDSLRRSGLYDEILARWTDKGMKAEMPRIELPTKSIPLRVGTTGMSVPFTFLKDGKYVGLDIEVVSRFAVWLNRPLELEIVSFGGLLPAAISKKVDLIANSILITPEREKSMAFSQPYYEAESVVMTLRKHLPSSDDAAVSGTNGVPFAKGLWQSLKESFQNNLITEKRYQLILDGLGITLLISLLAAVAGTLLGGSICFLRMSRNRLLRFTGKTYIDLMRGTPVLVFLMLMYYVVFAPFDTRATTVAVITFSMNLAAYVSEMFRSSIEGIDRGQTEAGIALGFTRVQAFIYIVLPQAVKSVLPVYKGELISLLKTTSIVGYIAVVDLTKASDIIRSRTFDAFFPLLLVAVVYFVVAWLLGMLLDYLGRDKTNKQ